MKRGLRILGLTLLAALGTTAMSVTAAQAAEVGSLKINGEVTGMEEEVALRGNGEALSLVAGGIEVQCEGSEIVAEASNRFNGKNLHLHAFFTVRLHGCLVAEEPFCAIYPNKEAFETEEEEGFIDISALLLWLTFHITNVEPLVHMDYVRLTPREGSEALAKFGFAGPICPLPTYDAEESMSLKGTTALRVPDFIESEVEHSFEDLTLVEEESLAEEGMELNLTLNGASAEIKGGNAALHLTGSVEGKPYSVE